MLTKEVMSLLGRKGKSIANVYYKANEADAMNNPDKTWFSSGFNALVTRSINHALETMGKPERVPQLTSSTANSVASKFEGC